VRGYENIELALAALLGEQVPTAPAQERRSPVEEKMGEQLPGDGGDRSADPILNLPAPPAPAANYVAARQYGGLLFIAGQLPFIEGQLSTVGRLGDQVDVETGQQLARLAALNALSVANAEVGTLRDVSVVNLTVFVASTSDFTSQHLVANGASDALVAALGPRGEHARTAVATPVLPLNSPVEVQVVFGLGDGSGRT
jgi:enamine deaminase RidA (YjgF/YER057c/UK114 family)